MSRIIVFESAQRTLRVIERCLGQMGYDLLAIDDVERLRLEFRAQEPELILASADAMGGSGLETVNDAYPECRTPVPVVAYTSGQTLTALKESAPVELRIAGLLSAPLDPGELVQTVVGLVTPPDAAAASKIVTDLRTEYETHGLRLEPPAGMVRLDDAPFARLLWAVDHNSWSGRITLEGEGAECIDYWFELGQFVHASTRGNRDLVVTAVTEGRVDATKLPPVELSNEEEQLGLLMALRAVGMHEVEGLRKRTRDRLILEGMQRREGLVEAAPGVSSPVQRDAQPVPRMLVRLVLGQVQELGERALQAHPDSVVVIRLPPSEVITGWGLAAEDRRVLGLIEKARNREITLDQLVRVASGGSPEQRPRVRALLTLLWSVGYVDFRGRPWDGETSARIEELVDELHRVRRSNAFEVMRLQPTCTDTEVSARARELARKYHPDTMFEEPARVQVVGQALYSHIQEAYEVLRRKDSRDALRREVQEGKRGQGTGSREPDKARIAIKHGEIYLRKKGKDNYARAEEYFRDATLHDPENPDAWTLLGWVRYLLDPSTSSGSTRTIEKAIKIDPKHANAWYFLGRIALLKDDTERARRRFAKAVGFDPKHVGAARELRLIERRSGGERRGEARSGLAGLFGRRRDDG